MAVSIVIGGQYGSEGKGKVAFWWAKKQDAKAVVRVGGSNSGHIVYDSNGIKYAFRMLPTASLIDDIAIVLPAGSYIDIDALMQEMELVKQKRKRIKIDPNAIVVMQKYKQLETENGLREKIGSTLSGTGAAVMARIRRQTEDHVLFAKDMEELMPFLTDTKTFLRGLLNDGKNIVIEGTQGYGLSNYHAKDYPYATSRDTTAAGFLAETGLSPFDVEHIIMVIRAFPIRVAGNSGPLPKEIDWGIVSEESGAGFYFEEETTVTHKVRRVARFDSNIVKEAIVANNPDIIVMNHVDYVDYPNKNVEHLSESQISFVQKVAKKINRKIDYLGNGEMLLIPYK